MEWVRSFGSVHISPLSPLKNNTRWRNTSSMSASVPFSLAPFVLFLRAQKLHIDFHYERGFAQNTQTPTALGEKYKYFKSMVS
jgi:hypothetical protein